MATALEIVIPDFDFTSFYYPEIKRSLIQYTRINVPEITDESEEEPFQQLLSAFALVGHLNNVLIDIVANEALLPTAQLLESVRNHLALIDVRLKQATPSSTDLVFELSKTFLVPIELVPADTAFATVETDEDPQIIFENDTSFTIQPSDAFTNIFTFKTGKIKIKDNSFDGGDGVNILGVDFRVGIEWIAGGNILASLDNLTTAISTSGNILVKDLIYAVNDGVDKIAIIQLDSSVESIPITKTDGATDNFDVSSGGFGADNAGKAATDGLLFPLFDETPTLGDTVYFGHSNVMWNQIEWLFDTFGSGITFVLEFFDNTLEDAKPTSVTNLGSALELDLTSLLGTNNRKGTVVRVVFSETGAQEVVVSDFVGGKNIGTTIGLLGQSTVSTDEEDYIVGTEWNEVESFTDGSTGFTEDGSMSYDLPQTQGLNWQSTIVNSATGLFLRLRVITVTAPVIPIVDRILMDAGEQFILIPVVQGQTVTDDPLGSSNGDIDQQFLLTFKPLIEETLTIEVNEGSGFQPWNLKENFLSSNSSSKDYTLEIDANDQSTIEFGDGKQGKVPLSGVDNIRAIYRIGADIDGNVGAKTITVNKGGISFVSRLFNPRQAIGFNVKEGSTPEDLARLKIEGPATLRTRNRGITTDDMEFLATQFTNSVGSQTVARAKAIEETFGVKTIELVVVGPGGALLTEAQRDELADFFNGNKELGIEPVLLANHELTPTNYIPKIINVTVEVSGGIEEEIKNAITALLNPEAVFSDGVTKRWKFGQEVPISVISATIFEVDPQNITKTTFTLPVTDTLLQGKELPLAGTILVTVI